MKKSIALLFLAFNACHLFAMDTSETTQSDELMKEMSPEEMDALLDSFYKSEKKVSVDAAPACIESEIESQMSPISPPSDDSVETMSCMPSESDTNEEIAPTPKKRKNAVTIEALARLHRPKKKRQRGQFKCKICGKVRAASNQARHMSMHAHEKKIYKCPIADCEMKFPKKEYLDEHIKIH